MTSQIIFKSKEESVQSKYSRKQSNERYPHFKQLIYTVGDEEQFVHEISNIYWGKKKVEEEKDDKLNMFQFYNFNFWEGYHSQEKINLIQTFRYIFYKFKKGIYVRIENNKLSKFIPMSNANFTNEWSEQLKVDYEIFKKVSALENRPYTEKSINKFVNCWFSNNCLLRYEYPINESDTNVSNIKNFFEELCLYRKVPDIDFFVNKRDFPLLSKNKTEPYYDIWGKNKPLVSHKYDTYLPILSMSKTEEYADILLPTHEDWARVQQNHNGIYFTDSRVEQKEEEDKNISFLNKKPTAVFRGSSTGDGLTIETNTRLKAAFLSLQNKVDPIDDVPYLDCGITKWNARVKKLDETSNIQVIEPESFPFGLVDYMSLSEQEMKYKYILHIDGHVSAFRLSMLLSLNCVILIVESKWKLWYSDLLVPYEHYIPIKSDLSDVYEQIQWCKEHDEMCELIAYNAMEFASKYLGKEGMFDYTQKMLIDLKRHMHYVEEEEHKVPPLPPISKNVTLPDGNDEDQILFENRNVIIRKVKGVPLIIKEKKIKQVPIPVPILKFDFINFSSMYGYNKDGNIVMDYVKGVKFYDYLLDKKLFNFQVYLKILIQISFALHEAQKDRLFVHNDLTPWNIILQFYDQDQHISYDNKKYRLASKVIPVIIDYDKCHVIDDQYIHRGTVNPYKFSSIQDILSLLFTSMFQIITHQNLSRLELSLILRVANFISHSQYNPKTFRSIHHLKEYLYSVKKHSSLIYSDKKDLELLGPLDFVAYLNKTVKQFYDEEYIRIPPMTNKSTALSSSSLVRINYDEYTFWSPTKCFEISQQIKDINVNEWLQLRQKFPEDVTLLRKICDVITFKTLYK